MKSTASLRHVIVALCISRVPDFYMALGAPALSSFGHTYQRNTVPPLSLLFRKHFGANCVYQRRAAIRLSGGRVLRGMHAETLGSSLGDRVCAVDAPCVPQRRGCSCLHGFHGNPHQLGATAGLEHHHLFYMVAAD